jgi:hypothetical protein
MTELHAPVGAHDQVAARRAVEALRSGVPSRAAVAALGSAQTEIGRPGLGQLDRALAVAGGLDVEAVAFQAAGDQADQRRLVVDHQRPERSGRLFAHRVTVVGHWRLTRSAGWVACGLPAARRSRA